MGFRRDGDEHRLEALARAGENRCRASIPTIGFLGDRLDVPAHFQASIEGAVGRNGSSASTAERASLAGQIQREVGGLLLRLVSDISRKFGNDRLCLGGGLFYNSYFTTLLAESGLFEDTFVSANPGNAGIAVGAALSIGDVGSMPQRREPLSPFLGPDSARRRSRPSWTTASCRTTTCGTGRSSSGRLPRSPKGSWSAGFRAGWSGAARALGNRSILASPVAPYVLENLNAFLKLREPHRTYSVAICARGSAAVFPGPCEIGVHGIRVRGARPQPASQACCRPTRRSCASRPWTNRRVPSTN